MLPATLYDILNLTTKLTAPRLWNLCRVYSSYLVTRLTGRPVQWGYPTSISFEPTTSCNLRCPECPSGLRAFSRPTGMLAPAFFQKTIDEIHRELLYLVFYFQGEPYLNPSFLEMVSYASQRKIYTATSTNAHYLDAEMARRTVQSGLDRLIISIDGTTQEVYQQYRVGGRLNKVLEGARQIMHWKKELKSRTPFVVFQFLVVKPNEHQIGAVQELAREIGVDAVWLKTAQVYDYETDPNQLIPENETYSRYRRQADGSYTSRNRMLNHCARLWKGNVITWDGLVVPCCFDKDATHRLGDLRQQTFKQIWHNAEYRKFRKSLTGGRRNIDICSNCSEGVKVWG